MKNYALTDVKCRNAKPKAQPWKLTDGQGMYLYITHSSKIWRRSYYFNKKPNTLTLGHYPVMSLAEAREANLAIQRQLSEGVNPSVARQAARLRAEVQSLNTFEKIGREWHAQQAEVWSVKHAANVMHKLETDLFPLLGRRVLSEIDPPELLSVIKRIEARGANEVAKRCKQIAGQIFTYGMAKGICRVNIAPSITKALKKTKTRHFPALETRQLPAFLKDLTYNEQRLYARTQRATLMLMHVFTRPRELTEARWDEFNFQKAEWIIPAERMKMREAHTVPLSRQVIALLKEQFIETGHGPGGWVFPSQIRPMDHMSTGTILNAIIRLGYGKVHTAHGFRAVARTTIREELEYAPDVIEKQLAHAVGDNTQRAYNRTKFLDERAKMMQEWSDYIDSITPRKIYITGTGRKGTSFDRSAKVVSLASAA